jgi:hypothetical protein
VNTQVAAFLDGRMAVLLKPSGFVAKSKAGDGAYAMGSCIVLRDSILMASSLVRSTLLDPLAPDDERAPFA